MNKSWIQIRATQALETEVMRVLRLHPLRCADAIQLASAILASDKSTSSLVFVTLDQKLQLAAEKEGFKTGQAT